MAKLTKQQAKLHAEACKLLEKDKLTYDEKWFVLENWQESANHVNSVAGAFFTPPMLARDFAIDVHGPKVIDLCAGIGCLSFIAFNKFEWEPERRPQFTCIEINPDYIAVGKKILPEAKWIQGDVFNLPDDIGHFDCAISNPPFGATKANGAAPRYTGRDFEYRVMDIASDLADYGAFIIPQMSAPFEYSGKRYLMRRDGKDLPVSEKCERFYAQTKIALDIGVGVDCSFHRGDWKGVAPAVEIVTCDFLEARKARLPIEPTRPDAMQPFQAGDIVTSHDGNTTLRVLEFHNDGSKTFDGECLKTGDVSCFWLKSHFRKQADAANPPQLSLF